MITGIEKKSVVKFADIKTIFTSDFDQSKSGNAPDLILSVDYYLLILHFSRCHKYYVEECKTIQSIVLCNYIN